MSFGKRTYDFDTGTTLTETKQEGEFDAIYNILNGTTDVDISVKGDFTAQGTATVTGTSTFTGVAGFANGTAAAPAITFTSDTDNGLYRIGANNIGMTIAGVKVLDITSNAFTITSGSGSASRSTYAGKAYASTATAENLIAVGSTNTGGLAFLITGTGYIGATTTETFCYLVSIHYNGTLNSSTKITGDDQTFDVSGGYLRHTGTTGYDYNLNWLRVSR